MQSPFENEYDIEKTIGRGSYAQVYKAREKNGNKELRAVKKMQLDPLCQQLGEVEQLRQLKGDHIIEFYGYIRQNNELSIIMHYCEGNLRQRLLDVGKLQPQEVINLITQVTSAMLVLQKSFVMHLDLKPENILIQSKSTNDYYKICDFGCSQIYKRVSRAENQNMRLHSSVKINDFIFGTPSYIAPEIQLGMQKIGTNSCDVWSLGIVIYQSIYRSHPFQRDESGRVKTEQFKNFADGKKEILFPPVDPAYPIDLLKQMLMPKANLRIKWIKIKESLIKNYGKSQYNFINIDKIYRHTIKISVIFANAIEDIKKIEQIYSNNTVQIPKLNKLRKSLVNFGFQQLDWVQKILKYKLQQKLNTSNLASIEFMKQWFIEEKKELQIQNASKNIKELEEVVRRDVNEISQISSMIASQIRPPLVENLLIFIRQASSLNTLLCRDQLRQIFTNTCEKYGVTK